MKRRILAVVLALGMTTGLLVGCGSSGGSESTDTSASSESKSADSEKETDKADGNTEVKPALLLSGSASDHSWNQFGYEALMAVQDELGVEVTYSENVSTVDQLQAIRDYAASGYNPIIGHGGAFEDDMIRVAEDFPDTQFIVVAGGTGVEPNVLAVDNAPWQYGYAYGWMAANVTEANKIGFITGMEGVSTMNNLVGGWRDGAKTANPDVQTSVVYISDMGDVAEAREAALSLQAAGCDVIMHELNAGMQGVIDVCAENNIYTLGRSESDKDFAPDQILTYVEFDWAPKFVDLVKKTMDGELQGGTYFYGFHTPEAPGFTFNYDEEHSWNPEVVSDELLDKFQTEVVDMFMENPDRTYTAEDAAGGTQ